MKQNDQALQIEKSLGCSCHKHKKLGRIEADTFKTHKALDLPKILQKIYNSIKTA